MLSSEPEQVALVSENQNKQDQRVCINTEAQVEDISTIETLGDSKWSVTIEQRAGTTDNEFTKYEVGILP